jgi:large subunit ribosomal protein L13
MSTFLPKPGDIKRDWYVLDAAGRPLGRTAALAATLLRGKHKPIFAPHVDCGDHVVIVNASQAVLTGNKLENKYYRRHSGWIGGLKEVKYSTLMKNNPEKAVMLAVKGMLPDNTLGRKALTRVRIYRGADHKHEAQQPKVWNELEGSVKQDV